MYVCMHVYMYVRIESGAYKVSPGLYMTLCMLTINLSKIVYELSKGSLRIHAAPVHDYNVPALMVWCV